MNLSHLLTASLAAALVCFIGGAKASPHFQAPVFSPQPLQVDLKCGLVNGKVVCGNKNSSGKHRNDDDQQGNDDEHHHKKKKKNNDDDTGLSECTIQGANSGGGCKGGLKYVCEKLKSGKKCCGCVVDKNAKPTNTPPVEKTAALVFACTSDVEAPDGRVVANRRAGIRAASAEEARIIYMTSLPQGVLLRGAVTCTQSSAP